MGKICIRGATEHNLQGVSVDIPKNRLVAFTGLSGSGKSSLVFDTIFAESFRRFADAGGVSTFVPGRTVVRHARPAFQSIQGLAPSLGISQRQGIAGQLSTVGTLLGASDLLRVYFAAFGTRFCRNCDIPLQAEPMPEILRQVLRRFGGRTVTVVALIAERRKGAFGDEIERFRRLGFSRLRVNGEIFDLQDESQSIRVDQRKLNTVEVLIDRLKIQPERQGRLERAVGEALTHGKGMVIIEADNETVRFNSRSACPLCGESAQQLDPRHFSHSSLGRCPNCEGVGAADPESSPDIQPCPTCKGSRLDPGRPTVRVCGQTYEQLHTLNLQDLQRFLTTEVTEDAGTDRARERVAGEAIRLVAAATRVGLAHLTLNRGGRTLVPGDLQRLRLATVTANRLRGAVYVIDEPCQGLSGAEVSQLVEVLRELVRGGASVLAVEHHPAFLNACDEVFVMGPGAGRAGGRIVAHYGLSGEPIPGWGTSSPVPIPSATRRTHPVGLEFGRVMVRSRKLPAVYVPQGAITILRGASGCGKLSFLELCLMPELERLRAGSKSASACDVTMVGKCRVDGVVEIRPGSLTRSSRRTVASALAILPHLRSIFAQLPQSQILGLSDANFSWHSKQGACELCSGKGYVEYEQRYGPPVQVECEKCLGARLQVRSLIPRFKGYNFAEFMQLTVEEALNILSNVRAIAQRLRPSVDFGLGYVRLGQSMDSLSGGELQRMVLTLELRRQNLEGMWFLLVHPSTGLHSPDIEVLGRLMRQLVQRGATFVAIENREEFLPHTDHVVLFS